MEWTSSDLKKHQHPYELWYEETGALTHPSSGESRETVWYPQLIHLELGENANKQETLFELATNLLGGGALGNVTILDHDWWYCWFLLIKDQLTQSELLIFTKADFDSRKLEHLRDEIPGLRNISVTQKGAPVSQTPQAAKATRARLASIVGKIAEPDDPNQIDAQDTRKPRMIGVIVDHALGFLNETFCKRGATARESRFREVWVQEDGSGNGSLDVGNEINRASINAALNTLKTDPYVSEGDLYQALKTAPMSVAGLSRRGAGILAGASHGTQTAQIAFGATMHEPDWDFDLLGIQLPAASVALTNGLLHDLYVKSGLNWAFMKAYEIEGKRADLFVNHSFGTYSGRHDGFGQLEADFEWRLASGKARMITQAAGNGFQTATHAAVTKEQIKDPKYDSDLTLVVPPGSKETTFVQFWADATDASKSAFPTGFEVTPPGQPSLSEAAFATGTAQSLMGSDGQLVAKLYCQLDEPKGISQANAPAKHLITLAISPTETDVGTASGVPAGDWRISFFKSGKMQKKSALTIWVERGDTPEGFPARGRQAYFTHPNYQLLTSEGRLPDGAQENAKDDCPIKRYGTLAACATSPAMTVVSAYRESDMRMSDFSAASSDLFPKSGANPTQPTLAAISESSRARPNVLTTGSFSGSTRFARGTSVSAPLALRHAIRNALQSNAPVADKDALIAALIPISDASIPKTDSLRAGNGFLPEGFKCTFDRRTN